MKTHQLQRWFRIEQELFTARNRLCISGARADQAIAEYDDEQQKNNRRLAGINKNRRLVPTLFV